MSSETDCGPLPTLCDLDTDNNHWFTEGVCMLDTMSKAQVVYVLQHNPRARCDLPKITTCQELLDLLNTVPLLSGKRDDDRLQSAINTSDCLPFYTVYRGNLSNK